MSDNQHEDDQHEDHDDLVPVTLNIHWGGMAPGEHVELHGEQARGLISAGYASEYSEPADEPEPEKKVELTMTEDGAHQLNVESGPNATVEAVGPNTVGTEIPGPGHLPG